MMNRREFLKSIGLTIVGGVLARHVPGPDTGVTPCIATFDMDGDEDDWTDCLVRYQQFKEKPQEQVIYLFMTEAQFNVFKEAIGYLYDS
jgi:hypothetical protein